MRPVTGGQSMIASRRPVIRATKYAYVYSQIKYLKFNLVVSISGVRLAVASLAKMRFESEALMH
jgi:hypothetical protein